MTHTRAYVLVIAIVLVGCNKKEDPKNQADPAPATTTPDAAKVAAPTTVAVDAAAPLTPTAKTPVAGLTAPAATPASADATSRGDAICQQITKCACDNAANCPSAVQAIAPHAPDTFWSCFEGVAADCGALCTEYAAGEKCYGPVEAQIKASMQKSDPAARGAALCARHTECGCKSETCQADLDSLVMDAPEPFWTCMEEVGATDCAAYCAEYESGTKCYAPHDATIQANKKAREDQQYRYSCWTTGVYEVCDGTYCTSYPSESMGAGPTEDEAALDANQRCSNHITQMVIINNMNSRASWKQNCTVSRCQKN